MKKKFKFDSKYIFVALFAALIICFIALLFSSPNDESEATMNELSDLTENIHNSFKQKPDYWGLNSKYIIDNNLVNPSAIKDDKIISVLGNEIIVGADDQGNVAMPGSKSFTITYKNISRKNCIILSSYNLDYAEKIGLLSITIKNAHDTKEFSWGGDNELPITITQAKDTCLSSENSIIWTFK